MPLEFVEFEANSRAVHWDGEGELTICSSFFRTIRAGNVFLGWFVDMLRFSVLLLFCLMPLAGAACTVDRPVNALFTRLATLPMQSGPVDGDIARRIGADIRQVESLRTRSAETLFRASETGGAIRDLMRQGRQIARTEWLQQPEALRQTLTQFRLGTEILCDAGARRKGRLTSAESADDALDPVPAALGFSGEVPVAVQTRRMGTLVALLVAVASSLFILQRLFERLSITFFDRRSCLIGARLEIGELPIDGQITVIGRGMCQFRPANEVGLHMLRHFAESEPSRIVIGDICVPTHVKWVSDEDAGCPFEMPLPAAFHREVLERSMLTPHVIESKWHEANIRRRFSTRSTLAYRLKPAKVRRGARAVGG